MLLMNGTDHQMPQPWLGRVVAEANAMQDDYEFVVTSLAEYLPAQPDDGIVTVEGESSLGGARQPADGCRFEPRRRAPRVRRRGAVSRTAGRAPQRALPAADRYPHALADIAWRNLVCNSAHDSSCACSIDEVVDQVLVRYYEARQIGDGLTRDAVRALAAQVNAKPGATVVVNPTARPRTGLVEVTLPGAGPVHVVDSHGIPRPTQIVGEVSGEAYATMVTGQKVRWVLDLMRGTEFAGRTITSYEITVAGDVHDIVLQEAGPGDPQRDLTELREQILDLGTRGETASLRLLAAPLRRALFDSGELAGFGWSCFEAVDGDAPGGAVTASETRLANEHLLVEIDDTTGTYTMTAQGLRTVGLGRLVDDGDGGDTYNYSPPAVDRVSTVPSAFA